MVFSSSHPLYHLDTQTNWYHQLDDQRQQQMTQQIHQEHTITSPQLTPPSQSGGVGCGGSTTGSIKPNSMVDRARQAQLPLPEAGLKCPRCESTNTKFCYFNNYNLSQPRHFCKTCRRYWTRGGSLRNVPVGGASRRTAKRTKARPGSSGTVTVSCGGARPLGTPIGGGNNNACSTSLFLSHNMPQLPFLPSLHHYANSNPNNIGLNLLSHGGSEMEFPNLLASFEGLGRMNGIHPYENNSSLGHQEVIGQMALSKIDNPRGVNLSNEFAHFHQGNDNPQFNWNTNAWTNNSNDISGFVSPSSNGHLLG